MDIKYFLGYKNVSYEEFMAEKQKAEAAGNVVSETRESDGLPEYLLQNGAVIRANGEGRFFRMAEGAPVEEWQVGTEDEYVQGEADGSGKVDFFFRVDDPAEARIG